jgi:hypothetical protein
VHPERRYSDRLPPSFSYRVPVVSNTGLAECWAWDLYPLGRGAWPSRQIQTDRLPGHTIRLTDTELVQRREPYIESPTAWRDGHTEVVQHKHHRIFYLPVEQDLSILRRCYPDADPNQPAWARIEADLIAAGRNARELSTFKAPTLIKLLDMARITPARAREQAPLSAQPEPQVEVESSEAEPVGATKTSPFSGGKMVFYPDRVELCGVDIWSGSGTDWYRTTLELLAKKDGNGGFTSYSGEVLAKVVGVSPGEKDAKKRGRNAAGLIKRLRTRISDALRSQANLECGKTDVILSGGPGYRFSDRLSVHQEGQPEKADITDMDGTGDDPNDTNDDVRDDPNDPNGNVHDDPNDPNDTNDPNGKTHDDPNVSDNTQEGRRAWILQRLEKGQRLNAPDVVGQFKCSMTTAKRDLKSLKDAGSIEFEGSSRTGHYRLPKATGADQ